VGEGREGTGSGRDAPIVGRGLGSWPGMGRGLGKSGGPQVCVDSGRVDVRGSGDAARGWAGRRGGALNTDAVHAAERVGGRGP